MATGTQDVVFVVFGVGGAAARSKSLLNVVFILPFFQVLCIHSSRLDFKCTTFFLFCFHFLFQIG